jgi:hypothetical protein
MEVLYYYSISIGTLLIGFVFIYFLLFYRPEQKPNKREIKFLENVNKLDTQSIIQFIREELVTQLNPECKIYEYSIKEENIKLSSLGIRHFFSFDAIFYGTYFDMLRLLYDDKLPIGHYWHEDVLLNEDGRIMVGDKVFNSIYHLIIYASCDHFSEPHDFIYSKLGVKI